MPAQYEAIKREMLLKGMGDQASKKHAAMIYNARRPEGVPPVTRNYDKPVTKGIK